MSAAINIHATGLVIGGVGVLIRGPSGSGKSLLALALLDRAGSRGEPAILIADDRVDLSASGGRVSMSAPAPIAGRVELRGRGIVERPFEESAELDLVVDLVDDLVRMPEPSAFSTELHGIAVARCPVPRRPVVDVAHQVLLVIEALGDIRCQRLAPRQKTT